MKVLFYSSHPQLTLASQSGPGTHMRETIHALSHLGHEVCPVIIGDIINGESTGIELKQANSGIRSFIKLLVPKIIWRSLKELQLLRRDQAAEIILSQRIIEFKPDLVYERGAYLQLSGINVLRKSGIKHFMELNAPFIDEVRSFEKAPTLWLRRAQRTEKLQVLCPDVVYVVSSALKKYYSRYTTTHEKIQVVPNSVNPEYLNVSKALRKSIVDEFHLNNSQTIGFVGSIFPYHGVDILIKAFSKISSEFPESRLLIVGDGMILGDLKALSSNLKVDDRIVFAGSRPHNEIFTWIDLMDICVMAKSNWYGSPVKIFEYGAMGKAIIAPNTIPVTDVMVHNKDGLLIEPVESELANALRILLLDIALKERLAENFRNKVLEFYTWKIVAEKIIKDLLTVKK